MLRTSSWAGQGALRVGGGVAPQRRRQRVPHNLPPSVVAVGADGLAEHLVVLLVALPAAGAAAVWAGPALAVGVAGPHQPALRLAVWTGPKLGAVKVTNNLGCSATDSG